MSATSARRLVTAGSLTLALALASPAAALAQSQEGSERGRSGSAQENKDEKKEGQPGSTSSSTQGSGASGAGSDRADKKSGQTSKRQGGAPAGERAKGGDPRGNNGTVKIDGEPFDDTPGNEPHVGCTFQVDFFGFDAGDTAQVTLTGHAPTGGGLLYNKNHLISNDAAGGGQDADESITFTAGQLGLFALTPHPQQGWHIKLAVDVDDAPGGAKQKVFWVTCAQPAAVSGSTTDAATGAGSTTVAAGVPATAGGGTTTTAAGLPVTAGGGAAAAAEVLSPRALEQSAPELTLGAGTTTLSGSTQAAAGAGGVTARGAARPSALPFTGPQGLAYLLALGASAVGVGALAHRFGRRRAVTTEL